MGDVQATRAIDEDKDSDLALHRLVCSTVLHFLALSGVIW
jgi:hypothetical protein